MHIFVVGVLSIKVGTMLNLILVVGNKLLQYKKKQLNNIIQIE